MDPFIGEIRAFGFGVIPRGWALCDGSTLSIQQNQALYALLGTTYGGDGVRTFQLPDLRGRVSVGQGVGTDGRSYPLGQAAGQEGVALTVGQMPRHRHLLSCVSSGADSNSGAGALPASAPGESFAYAGPSAAGVMAADALASSGASIPHNNMQPSLTVNFCIAVMGLFPPRS